MSDSSNCVACSGRVIALARSSIEILGPLPLIDATDAMGLQPIVVFDSSISRRFGIVVYEKWKDNRGAACYAQLEMKTRRIAGLLSLFMAISDAQPIRTGP